jgi:hypothetical protein
MLNRRFSRGWVAPAALLVAAVLAAPVPGRGQEPLATVREAFRASSTALTSGSGTGVYRVYESVDGGDWVITTDADLSTHFEGKKYFVGLRYHPELRGLCCRRFMYDGKSLRTAWFSTGMVTRGQVGEINVQDYGDGLSRPELADFPWDVARLSSNAWNIERLIKNVPEARIKIKQTSEGDLVGTYRGRDSDRFHEAFECPRRFGFNIARRQVFNDGESRAAEEYRVEWKQTENGLWYVRSLQHELIHRDEGKRFRQVMKFTDFEPNAKVDAGVFTKAFLEMPLGDRISDGQK